MSVALHVYYRSYGGDNDKPRPAYYSKPLALASLLRAVEATAPTARITFLNDGRIDSSLLAVMGRHGRVIHVNGGSNRASYRRMVALAAKEQNPSGVLWFAEDDYLYRANALSSVQQAAEVCPDADYFTLYCSAAVDTDAPHRVPTARPQPGAEGVPGARSTGDVRWFPAMSSTSTFGVRTRVLREDAGLLRLTPYAGGAWDETTCRAYQGRAPFTPDELRADLLSGSPRSLVRGLARSAATARSLRRPSHRRLLVGSDPELVTHMETEVAGCTPPSSATLAIDWAAEAEAVRVWAKTADVPLP